MAEDHLDGDHLALLLEPRQRMRWLQVQDAREVWRVLSREVEEQEHEEGATLVQLAAQGQGGH